MYDYYYVLFLFFMLLSHVCKSLSFVLHLKHVLLNVVYGGDNGSGSLTQWSVGPPGTLVNMGSLALLCVRTGCSITADQWMLSTSYNDSMVFYTAKNTPPLSVY